MCTYLYVHIPDSSKEILRLLRCSRFYFSVTQCCPRYKLCVQIAVRKDKANEIEQNIACVWGGTRINIPTSLSHLKPTTFNSMLFTSSYSNLTFVYLCTNRSPRADYKFLITLIMNSSWCSRSPVFFFIVTTCILFTVHPTVATLRNSTSNLRTLCTSLWRTPIIMLSWILISPVGSGWLTHLIQRFRIHEIENSALVNSLCQFMVPPPRYRCWIWWPCSYSRSYSHSCPSRA